MEKYVAIDVGGTSIKYGLIEGNGIILERGSISTRGNDINELIADIKEVVCKYKEKYEIKGLACSFPGAVDPKSGFIGGGSAVACIHGPNIKNLLEEATGLVTAIENDANCSALAECWIGAGKDVDSFASVVFGTGIGGAIVINKRIFRGRNSHAGEFGYMLTTDSNENLGPFWSWIASTGSIVRRIAEVKNIPVDELNGNIVFEMQKNDEQVKREVKEWYKRIAKGIYNIQYILDPDKILIGGGISARDEFIEGINEELKLMKDEIATLDITVEKCKFGNDSNLIGALYNLIFC